MADNDQIHVDVKPDSWVGRGHDVAAAAGTAFCGAMEGLPAFVPHYGDDIGGIDVHIGARVNALAGPNDVLVSSTLRDLVIGSGLEFEDRGSYELKGMPGEWRLFAVASP